MAHSNRRFPILETAAFRYPIIDNHAHNLLKESHSNAYQVQGVTTEAQGEAFRDATHTLASYRAALQLPKIYGCEPTFEAIQATRVAMPYEELCKKNFEPTGIACLLLDDLMDNVTELCYDYTWHDRLTTQKTKRIVRVEALAQNLIRSIYSSGDKSFDRFTREFSNALLTSCRDKEVVGFKSVVCYRTGLDVENPPIQLVKETYGAALKTLQDTGKIRISHKHLNDFIVRKTLEFASEYHKPVQFHTGLGDNDITLTKANPAVLQPLIKDFPNAPIVLLHSSYPFTQEAGYLTTVYKNVYLDFGEVFPMVSRDGQRQIIRQVLELSPTNKILWSTDGHWWPESYYLAVIQVREALYDVLADSVTNEELTEVQAAKVVENVFYHNSNNLYRLGLPSEPLLHSPTTNSLSLPSSALPTASAKKTKYTLDSLAKAGTKFVRIHWVDYNNRIMYRVVPIERLQEMLAKSPRAGVTVAKSGFSLVDGKSAGGLMGAGDYFMAIDLDSLRPPSYADGHAFAMGVFQEKELCVGLPIFSEFCPRRILQRIIDDAKDKDGLEFRVGFETEFALLNPSELDFHPVNEHSWSFSSAIPAGSKIALVLDEICEKLKDVGIIVEQYHSEIMDGGYEIVTGPLSPVEAVDALVLTRETMYQVAQKHGLKASLIPKPVPHKTGISNHTHISIKSRKGYASSKNELMSKLEASFLQSLLDHLPAISAFTLSSQASYWRMGEYNFAGGKPVCWAQDNRAVPVRLCGSKEGGWNFEVKPVDGLSNPYLAVAALLAGGILGVRKSAKLTYPNLRVPPAESVTPEAGEKVVPGSYNEAVFSLENDHELTAFLGGEEFVERYVAATDLRAETLDELPETDRKRWIIERY